MFFIADDGTMDTVVRCGSCAWEGRYSPDEIVGGYIDGDNSERAMAMRRVADVLEIAAQDHDTTFHRGF